jgi:hypothetical protein
VKIRISELRKIIRQVLSEKGWGVGVTADPTEGPSGDGFYPYEIERGVDIYGKWYKSPGESEGDPGRPADPEEYIGIKPKDTGGSAEE